MNLVSRILDTPIGELELVATGTALRGVLYARERSTAEPAPGPHAILDDAALQLGQYFAGARRQFDLPLELEGTPFQREVWRALADIAFGQTLGYGELGRRLGRKDASRAIGAANGRNPISIVLPCHRVIGADGSLTGYGGGLGAKAWLLEHEARLVGGLSGQKRSPLPATFPLPPSRSCLRARPS